MPYKRLGSKSGRGKPSCKYEASTGPFSNLRRGGKLPCVSGDGKNPESETEEGGGSGSHDEELSPYGRCVCFLRGGGSVLGAPLSDRNLWGRWRHLNPEKGNWGPVCGAPNRRRALYWKLTVFEEEESQFHSVVVEPDRSEAALCSWEARVLSTLPEKMGGGKPHMVNIMVKSTLHGVGMKEGENFRSPGRR